MTERVVPPEAWHRLHPLTVITELLRLLGQFAYLLLAAFAARFFGGSDRFDEPFFAALGGAGVLVALLRYLSLRYALWEGTLHIRKGVLFRQARAIPVDRIQNIDLKESLLGRIAGVVDLKIETASGAGAEAALSVLSRDAAARLKADLLAQRGATPAVAPPAEGAPERPPEPSAARPIGAVPLWQASLGDLLLLGATQNRAGAILGAIAGLFYLLQDLVGAGAQAGEGVVRAVFGMAPWAAAAAAAIALLILFAAGWLVSIVVTVVRYAGFTLAAAPRDRLVRSYGLLTRYESVIPLARLQALRLVANWPRRALGFWSVYAETAGSFVDQDTGGASVLVPLLEEREKAALFRRILPGLDLDGVRWEPVSRHAIRRGFIRYAILAAIVWVILGLALGHFPWWPVPVLGAAALGMAWLRWRTLCWARAGEFWLASSGVWRRTVWIIPERKIQWVALRESPFQRRLSIATLDVATAGAGPASGARVVDLPVALAREIGATLAMSAASAALQPDGV